MSANGDDLVLTGTAGLSMPPPHDHAIPVADALPLDGASDLLPSGTTGAAGDDPDTKVCRVRLPDGCYRLTYRPSTSSDVYRGTLRVDRSEGTLVISGDLYRFLPGADIPDAAPARRTFRSAIASGALADRDDDDEIPIFPRGRYHSYLRGIGAQLESVVARNKPCEAILSFEQYDYTQPPPGQFDGTFPAAPGSRLIELRLRRRDDDDNDEDDDEVSFRGTLVQAGTVRGRVTLAWVSRFFRRCTIEIDTVTGAVPPQAVPALNGAGSETFRTMLASAGWLATIRSDQVNIPSPIPDPTVCWTDGQLHALMEQVRAATDVDAEWRLHLLVVQGRITCSRGKMYDSIGAPREGVVSYSDDGYPAAHSANFGAAEGQMQRNVPRAYLRSASHELVHGFNQIHQEQEGGADNSIMTTTPSVADVLGGPTTGQPGVFPDAIRLQVNTHVRHHMVHFPDPLVRPGGHTFGAGHASIVPEADRYIFQPDELELRLTAENDRIAVGEPLRLSWTVTNTGAEPLPVPTEITTESLYATVTVVDGRGRRRDVRPFVIDCEATRVAGLAPGESRQAEARIYWSTAGFAFPSPGPYTVELSIDWTAEGVPCTVRNSLDVFVAFPTSAADNDAAATLLHPEVGKWVALGGDAPHLGEAATRLRSLMEVAASVMEDSGVAAPRALRGYEGLLPSA